MEWVQYCLQNSLMQVQKHIPAFWGFSIRNCRGDQASY